MSELTRKNLSFVINHEVNIALGHYLDDRVKHVGEIARKLNRLAYNNESDEIKSEFEKIKNDFFFW